MDPVAELERARASGVELELEPGLSPDEIDSIAEEVGAPLPRELRTLLAHTAGFASGPLEIVDFSGRQLSFEDVEIFPVSHPIAGDGYGNHWVLDLTPQEQDVAPIFYACHDPPVILYQSPDLGHFVHELLRMLAPPHESLVDDVHEDRLFHVWRENPATLDHAEALAGDGPLSEFAAGLDERFTFVDLRSPVVGMGFSWGRYGPRTEIRRAGFEHIWAYAPREKEPGRLSRLFGRR